MAIQKDITTHHFHSEVPSAELLKLGCAFEFPGALVKMQLLRQQVWGS